MSLSGLSISGRVVAILAIVFGIVVLIKPEIIAYLIGIYLIIMGVLYFVKK